MKKVLILCIAAVCVVAIFAGGLRVLERTAGEEAREQLEAAVRQAAVACYASEGIYPPDLAYLQEHYGLQIDGERYLVSYEVFADNLMPSILVVEREP